MILSVGNLQLLLKFCLKISASVGKLQLPAPMTCLKLTMPLFLCSEDEYESS